MKITTLFIILILVTSLVALVGCSASAYSAPDTLEGFLTWLATSGGIGAVIAFVFEKAPYVDEWFAALDSKAKRAIILASSFVVPSIAMGVAVALGYYEPTPDTVYMALRAGFEAFTVSQLAHMIVLK